MRQAIEQAGRPPRAAIDQLLNPPVVRRARAPDDADDLIAFRQQQFGKVRSVLPGDPGDNGPFGHATFGKRERRARQWRAQTERLSDVTRTEVQEGPWG